MTIGPAPMIKIFRMSVRFIVTTNRRSRASRKTRGNVKDFYKRCKNRYGGLTLAEPRSSSVKRGGFNISPQFWRYRAEVRNCRGRASRVCVVPDATLKQASCVVGPVARPLAAPVRLENRLRRLGKSLEAFPPLHTNLRLMTSDSLPSFPMLRSSLPNPSGEAEGLAQSWGGGRNAVSVCRDRTAPNAHRAPPDGFPNLAR